jgi:hypothetical protein
VYDRVPPRNASRGAPSVLMLARPGLEVETVHVFDVIVGGAEIVIMGQVKSGTASLWCQRSRDPNTLVPGVEVETALPKMYMNWDAIMMVSRENAMALNVVCRWVGTISLHSERGLQATDAASSNKDRFQRQESTGMRSFSRPHNRLYVIRVCASS